MVIVTLLLTSRVIWCFHCFRCGEIFVGVCWLVICSVLLLRFSLCFVAFNRGCSVSVQVFGRGFPWG